MHYLTVWRALIVAAGSDPGGPAGGPAAVPCKSAALAR